MSNSSGLRKARGILDPVLSKFVPAETRPRRSKRKEGFSGPPFSFGPCLLVHVFWLISFGPWFLAYIAAVRRHHPHTIAKIDSRGGIGVLVGVDPAQGAG